MEFWRVPFDADTIQVTLGIVHILEDRCKGCGFCIEFCPQHILVRSPRMKSYLS